MVTWRVASTAQFVDPDGDTGALDPDASLPVTRQLSRIVVQTPAGGGAAIVLRLAVSGSGPG